MGLNQNLIPKIMSKSNPVQLWRYGRTRALFFTQKLKLGCWQDLIFFCSLSLWTVEKVLDYLRHKTVLIIYILKDVIATSSEHWRGKLLIPLESREWMDINYVIGFKWKSCCKIVWKLLQHCLSMYGFLNLLNPVQPIAFRNFNIQH